MKKIAILFVLFSGLFSTDIAAQPSFFLDPQGNIEASDGDQVCIPVTTENFTDLLSITLSLNWDPNTLQFASISNLNPNMTNLSLGSFDISAPLVDNGILTFDWVAVGNYDCGSNVNNFYMDEAITLNDGEVLFEICFDVTGIYGGFSEVKISNTPEEIIVTRQNSGCIDIGNVLQTTCTSVAVEYTPVTFNISSASGQMGSTECVTIAVEDFNQILSMQFSINFDPTVLQFVSFQEFNLNGVVINDNDADQGNLNFSWADPTIQPITLPDGSVIVEICFELIGDGGDNSPVTISSEPVPIEIVDEVSQNNPGGDEDLTPLINAGTITIENFDPNGITLNIADAEVCIGEEFCVNITVEDFFEIEEIGFSVNWNPNVLQFDGWSNAAISTPTVNTSQASQGILTFEKDAPGTIDYTLFDGQSLITLCFMVVGDGGSTSVISITNNPLEILVDQDGTGEIGMNTNSGLISVKDTPGITLIAGDDTGFPGDEVCIDIDVADFDEVESTIFSISWNGQAEVLQFTNVIFGDLPDLLNENFNLDNTNNGVLGFEWQPFGDAVSLPNGSTIFSICFEIIGNPLECTSIDFGDFPFPVDIETTSSNGTNVGLNGQPGEVCTENPNQFFTSISDEFGAIGSETCVEISVQNFVQMTENSYTINWNFDDLEFVSVNSTGVLSSFDSDDWDESQVADGNLIINWNSDNIQGESVDNQSVIFEVCFNVIGEVGDCVPISIENTPQEIVVTSAPTGNANVGLTAFFGEICITDVLSISDITIEGVDCPGSSSGEIDFSVAGGSTMYNYQWEGPTAITGAPPAQNLIDGTYFVTISDSGGITLDTSFVVGSNPNAPVADAGDDFAPDCDQGIVFLDGTGSSGMGAIEYLWTGIGGCNTNIFPGDETEPQPQVFGPCSFQLQVTEIATGCVVFDTVSVLAQITPQPLAGDDLAVDCVQDTAFITPELPAGNNYSLEWSAISGTIYTPIDQANASVSAGEFVITLIQNGGGCAGTDTILVADNAILPTAEAGMDGVLGCSDVSVPLSAAMSSSATGNPLEFMWSTTMNGNICSDATLVDIDACGAGEYTVTVTDTSNGCTATDFVMVMGDTLKPISNGGPDVVLNCLNEGIGTLDGIESSTGVSITYSWMLNGAEIATDAVTQVDEIGEYTLVVTNIDNGCTATSIVNVTEDNTEPTVDLTAVFGQIDCNVPEDTLLASTNVPNATFNWNIIADDSVAIINMGGAYSVTVTNTNNGCSSEESITIDDLSDDPEITAGEDQFFDCTNGDALLEGAIVGNIPNAIIQWSTDAPGGLLCFETPATELQPTVSCAGIYTLTVQDPATGCIAMDEVMVTVDMTMPVIVDATTDTITCISDCATLAFGLEDPNMIDDVIIEWIANGSVLAGETDPTLEICEDGIYEVVVTHEVSGCTDGVTLTVTENTSEPALADAGDDAVVDCDNPMATLDASTSLITGETTIQWFDNETPPNAVGAIDEAVVMVGEGIFNLVVTNIANGCTATDQVEITSNGDLPNVDAGDDLVKGCNDPTVTLDGSASDPGNYEWTDENGYFIGNDIMVNIALEGTYTLTVTDPNTGCSASDEVTVTFNIDLPDADAMADADECDAEAMLLGNLPNEATGIWTALNSGNLTNADSTETTATGLTAGENCFVWALSSGTCTNYSADTVCVTTATATLNAIEDEQTVLDTMTNVAINVLTNDQIGDGNVTFNVIGMPDNGKLDSFSTDGIIYYTPTVNFMGEVVMDYEICSVDCPDVCDTATLLINVELSVPPIVNEVPNGITPNNDGVNDALVFDILIDNPEEFPNNEIVIFNRWGDIIYDASPYLNDWNGVNESGDDLPEGTYYYILRLDFGQSEIIRGDVTIVR